MGQDIVHTYVAIGHAIAAANHAEFYRGAASTVHAVPDTLGHLAQVEVAGVRLTPGIGNANDGPGQIVRGKAHRLIGGTVILVTQAGQKLFTAFHKHSPNVTFSKPGISPKFFRIQSSSAGGMVEGQPSISGSSLAYC